MARDVLRWVADPFRTHFERRADGLGPARQVTSGLPSFPFAATPDGTILFVREFPPDSRWDIGVVPMQNPASRQTVERTTASENNPVLSPDGRWLTYQSSKTGRFEIYVRPFPLSGQGDIAVTAEGGTRPVMVGGHGLKGSWGGSEWWAMGLPPAGNMDYVYRFVIWRGDLVAGFGDDPGSAVLWRFRADRGALPKENSARQ